MAKLRDLTGQTFGRLTAVKRVGRTLNYESIWEMECACGGSTNVSIGCLTSGATRSCGCIAREILLERSVTHGMSNTPEHATWVGMVQRCLKPSTDHAKKYYGGTELQESWKKSFTAFVDHVGMQPKDGKKCTIERILNSKGYVEGNVRWATQTEQARNKTLQTRSRTGVNGVTMHESNRFGHIELSYKAVVYNLNGTKTQKSFSVAKYGLLPAFKMACIAREDMITRLNTQGAGYSENHGK